MVQAELKNIFSYETHAAAAFSFITAKIPTPNLK
jgi:hypothetical protein